MILRSLVLTQFRNFRREQIQPGRAINIFWGNNAQGKTNLLEAIFLLSNLKSFRAAKTEELILLDEKQAMVAAEIEKGQVRHQLAVGLAGPGKSCRIDGKQAANAAEFLGFFKTVLFAPEEINLVKSFPAGRRSLLDRAVFFTAPEYLQLARDYQRQLKQRNRLLKETRNLEQLKPWTEGLIRNGARLRRERCRYLERLTPLLREIYSQISGVAAEQVDISYRDAPTERHEERLEEEFAAVAEREWRYQQTLAGPHRDDPLFLLQGRQLKAFGSQGQQRSFILAFKCAQVIDLERQTGEKPVLLLDDLSSELDPRRRRAFYDFVLHREGQVFLTTTDIALFENAGGSATRTYRLDAGAISETH